MSSSFIIWLLVSIIGVVISIVNKKKQREAKARTVHKDTTETAAKDQWDGREFVAATAQPEPQSDVQEWRAVAEEDVEYGLGGEETDDLLLEPALEGNYRRFYAEAEHEGELYQTNSFATEEGQSAISEAALRAAKMEELRSHQQTNIAPILLPDGSRFNLQTAMIYDVILHRRMQGLMRLRHIPHS